MQPLNIRKASKTNFLSVLAAAIALTFATYAFAQFSVTITVDENGQGTLMNSTGISAPLPASVGPDPGPGGLPNALTYGLLSPPGLTAGDLVLLEGVGGPISDVIRFNTGEICSATTGCLVFYSDFIDGADALADVGFPGANYTNLLT